MQTVVEEKIAHLTNGFSALPEFFFFFLKLFIN